MGSETQKKRMVFKPISLEFHFIEKLWQTASNTNLRVIPSERVGELGYLYTNTHQSLVEVYLLLSFDREIQMLGARGQAGMN